MQKQHELLMIVIFYISLMVCVSVVIAILATQVSPWLYVVLVVLSIKTIACMFLDIKKVLNNEDD